MSVVTNLIVTWGCGEGDSKNYDEDIILRINNYFKEDTSAGANQRFPIVRNTDWYGGSKHLECGLAIGAFNYLNLEEFIEYLKSINWKYKDEVQVIVKEQDDMRFRVIDIFPDDEVDEFIE